MRTFVTTIGEKTTDICVQQLSKYGFDSIVISGNTPWIEKYKEFIELAYRFNEDCLRVDADIIVNEGIVSAHTDLHKNKDKLMIQYSVYDLYKNGVSIGQPVLYSKKAISIIRQNLSKISPLRPEASAWRLPEINEHTLSIVDEIVGMHGFYQDKETVERAKENKINRKQIDKYDFDLVNKLMNL